jgi:hypothetical protein
VPHKPAFKIKEGRFKPKKNMIPKGLRLFKITPIHSIQQRSIVIDKHGLHSILYNLRLQYTCLNPCSVATSFDYSKWAWKLFDFKRIGIKSYEKLSNKYDGVFVTDGYSISFVFHRTVVASV